jgi:hypothetical protein
LFSLSVRSSSDYNDDESDGDEEENLTNIDDAVLSHGPHLKLSRGDELYEIEREFKMVNEQKFICSLGMLISVFQSRCQTRGCCKVPKVTHHFVGTTVVINCSCSSGHKIRFCSSHEVNGIYANNLLAAASIMLSGNNYGKVKRMANFYGLSFLSKSSYHRFQRLYLIPEINDWWSQMREEILGEFAGKAIVIGGDGQCDSPGFNAKNICYFRVEVNTNYIIGIEILDKRHVGLISTNMENEAVKRGLNKLKDDNVKISELVTDASTSVKTLLAWLSKYFNCNTTKHFNCHTQN